MVAGCRPCPRLPPPRKVRRDKGPTYRGVEALHDGGRYPRFRDVCHCLLESTVARNIFTLIKPSVVLNKDVVR